MSATTIRPRRPRTRLAALAAVALSLSVGPRVGDVSAADALENLRALRGRGLCPPAQTDDHARSIAYRGRPAVEIKARGRDGGSAGTMHELAIFDAASGRLVMFVCYANASTRKQGEPIISLSEISTRANALAGAAFAEASLELESIQRYQASGLPSIYYEARFTPALTEYPFFEPPVRLLLNATTGRLFRLESDPVLEAIAPPRTQISRQAAERIASVVMNSRDLAPTFGSGAIFVKAAAAELFAVKPNGWLGTDLAAETKSNQVAWVVPIQIAGGSNPGTHSLFIDAATGRVLGGQEKPADEVMSR